MTPRQIAGWLGAAALVLLGAGLSYWWMDARLERCRDSNARLSVSVEQRDATISSLQLANQSLSESLAKQNASVLQMTEDAKRRESAAVAALSEARKGQDATRRQIAALGARIQAGEGDCSAAVAEVRTGL